MPRIILASTSSSRKQLLDSINLKYEIIASNYHEDMNLSENPVELVKELSLGKAMEVAKNHPEAFVIGGDTIVVVEDAGKITKLSKPETKENAIKMLKAQSGKIVKLYSGIAVVNLQNNQIEVDFDLAEIHISTLTDQEIENYLIDPEPLSAAGGIILEKKAALFIKKIDGSFSTVLGLPIYKLGEIFKKLNFPLL